MPNITLSQYRELQQDGGWKSRLTILLLSIHEIEFEREYKFHSKRKWRFDYVIHKYKVAIEYEGIFQPKKGKSRHTNVTGYVKDTEKYNAAAVLGWRVLRYTAKNYTDVVRDVELIIKNHPN